MANYTKNKPGAPDSGRYAYGDTVLDSNNVTWLCVQSGIPGMFVPNTFSTGAGAVIPTASQTGMTVKDIGVGGYHTTTLTLTDWPLVVTDALAYAGKQLLDFPEGRVYVIGAIAVAQFGVTTVRASTINNSSTIDWSIGTATASNVVLSATMIDLGVLVDEQAIGDDSAYGAAGNSVLAAAAFFDGTSTAKDAFFNVAFSDNTDIDADGTLKITGTIQITWLHLGDK